jgi:hypothetical protein
MVDPVELYHGKSSSYGNFNSPHGRSFYKENTLEREWQSRGKGGVRGGTYQFPPFFGYNEFKEWGTESRCERSIDEESEQEGFP